MRIAIDELTIDTESFELKRGDQTVAIEPKVLELLLFLIEHRGRVVSKKELVEQVWDQRHISDSALTRAIYEARRVLGDDAKRQVMIKTLYRRGYQLIGPVTELPDEEMPGPEAPVAGSSATGVPAAKRAKYPAPDGTATAPPDAEHQPQAPSSATSKRLWVAGVMIAALSVAAWWLQAKSGGHVPAVAVGEPAQGLRFVDSLAVLPIAVASRDATPVETEDPDPQLQLTALSIADQITVRFAAQPGLTVRSLEISRTVDQLGLDPEHLFDTLRVEAILKGHLRESSVAGRYRLSLDLLVAGIERPVHIGIYEVTLPETPEALDDFLRVREAIAEDVLEHLSPTLASRVPDEISPAHPEALRLYLEARRRLATITCGDASVLIDLIDRSLAFDPEYPMAWAAKGFAIYSEAWSCGRDASYAEQALEAAREARRLAPSLSLALLLETFLLTEKGDAEKAYAQVLAFEKSTAPSAASRYAAAYTLRYAGFLDASKAALEQSLELDPLVLREFSTAPVTLLYRGEVDAFLAQLPAEDTPHDRFYRGLALVHRDDLEAARQMLLPAFELNPTDLFARYAASLLSALDGDSNSALELVGGVVHQRRSLGNRDGELTFKEAQLMALAGDVSAAIERLGQAVEDGFFCPRCLRDEPGFDGLHGESEYERWIDRATARHRAFAARFDLDAEL